MIQNQTIFKKLKKEDKLRMILLEKELLDLKIEEIKKEMK